MEDSAIIVAIIAAVASIFGALFSYFSNRYNSKADKTTNILEEQYLKVISPIHQSLHSFDPEEICNTIDSIIRENYYLLPDKLLDNYMDFRSYALSSKVIYDTLFEKEFVNQVCEFYRILRYKLGYSKIKITKKEKQSEKLLASSRSFKLTDLFMIVFLIIITLCSFSACIFFYLAPFIDASSNRKMVILTTLLATFLTCIEVIVTLFRHLKR